MARQGINVGVSANDGTGDTLRDGAVKINANFEELYSYFGGDSSTPLVTIDGAAIVFDGLTADSNQTTLVVVDPTSDNIVTIPDDTGVVVLDASSQTLSNKKLINPLITTPSLKDSDGATYGYNFIVNPPAANRTITIPTLTANDTIVFRTASQTLTNKTLTSPTINTGKFDHIHDTNGAEMLIFNAASSAVNYLSMTNSAAGNGVSITTEGADTNVDLSITAKGTGHVVVDNILYTTETISSTGTIAGTGTVVFGNSSAGTYTITVPDGKDGDVKHFININSSTANLQFDSKTHGSNPYPLTTVGHTLSVVWGGGVSGEWYEIASTQGGE